MIGIDGLGRRFGEVTAVDRLTGLGQWRPSSVAARRQRALGLPP